MPLNEFSDSYSVFKQKISPPSFWEISLKSRIAAGVVEIEEKLQ